jgi:D-tyrosyl-tRNA(Tyr) deacylase
MKLLLQRVNQASVTVDNEVIGEIQCGLLVLAGFGVQDHPALPETDMWSALIRKMLDLRIFPDGQGKMNLGLRDYGGELLLVPQFTLYADCRKGKRPSFTDAAPPDVAQKLFDRLVCDAQALLQKKVSTGRFGAEMYVQLTNWGPVTIELCGNASGGQNSHARQQLHPDRR